MPSAVQVVLERGRERMTKNERKIAEKENRKTRENKKRIKEEKSGNKHTPTTPQINKEDCTADFSVKAARA